MITLIGGNIQGPNNLAVPFGSVVFQLNVDATVVAAPHGFVAAAVPVVFQFDRTGNLIQPAKLWSNEELQPQLSPTLLGTYYLTTFYDQNGAKINLSPLWFQFPEIAGSTVDIGNVTPVSTVGGVVIFYPTNFGASNPPGTVTSVTFTGDGTVLSATPSAPVTTTGTLTATLLTQSANLVFAGPASGPAAAPTFRALVAADFPAGTGNPAGSTTDVQINLAGVFYADGNFTYTPSGTPTVHILGNFTETGVMTLTSTGIAATPLVVNQFSASQTFPIALFTGDIAIAGNGTTPGLPPNITGTGSGAIRFTRDSALVWLNSNATTTNSLLFGSDGFTNTDILIVAATGLKASIIYTSTSWVFNPQVSPAIGDNIVATQRVNGQDLALFQRATDAASTGNFLRFRNFALNADIFKVDVTGAITGSTLTVTAATPTGSAGQLSLGTTTATSATAGANGDVPAQVVGYLVFDLAGTKIKVPYYAV